MRMNENAACLENKRGREEIASTVRPNVIDLI